MNRLSAQQLIQGFEQGSLPKEQWTHEAHFVMALWYCFHLPLPQAVMSIKEGIKKYNLSIGGINSNEAGYHETITVFYIRMIIDYLLRSPATRDFDRLLLEITDQPFLRKDYPLQFYTKEILMSKEARRTWVEPVLPVLI